MRSVYEQRIGEANEIAGRLSTGRDGFVHETRLSAVCKVLWPDKKIAAHLAALVDRDERTAKRWLAGEFEPPNVIVLAVMSAIFGKRDHP